MRATDDATMTFQFSGYIPKEMKRTIMIPDRGPKNTAYADIAEMNELAVYDMVSCLTLITAIRILNLRTFKIFQGLMQIPMIAIMKDPRLMLMYLVSNPSRSVH